MTTRPTVGWCHSALEFIGMSTLALWMKQDSLVWLVICFKQSEFEGVDVVIFIYKVDSQVFVKGIVFSSVFDFPF